MLNLLRSSSRRQMSRFLVKLQIPTQQQVEISLDRAPKSEGFIKNIVYKLFVTKIITFAG